METKKLKRVVIKEELYSLTKDTIKAIILGQLIYWQDKVNDFDKFIEEERQRCHSDGTEINIEKQNGWMYKKASDLADDCMLNLSEVTIRRYIQDLIDCGYLESRKNPTHKWDKTLQYRVNLFHVIKKVKELGYDGLSGYTTVFQNEDMKLQNEDSEKKNEAAITEITDKDYNKEGNNVEADKDWRNNYEDYLQIVNEAKDKILKDYDFYNQCQKYYPNANYCLTIEKMVEIYWGTEAGWNNKRKSRSKNIDMISTFKNNFGRNIVYKAKGQKDDFVETKKSNDELIINGVKYQ